MMHSPLRYRGPMIIAFNGTDTKCPSLPRTVPQTFEQVQNLVSLLSAAILRKIEHEDTRVAASGPLKHFGMAKRMDRIAIAGEPTLLNGLAGEFVLFGGVFGVCRPVDQVYQVMHTLLGR